MALTAYSAHILCDSGETRHRTEGQQAGVNESTSATEGELWEVIVWILNESHGSTRTESFTTMMVKPWWKETSDSTTEKITRFKFWPFMSTTFIMLFIATELESLLLATESCISLSFSVLWSSAELQSAGKQLPVASSNDTFYRCHVLPFQERLHHSSVSKNVTSSSLRSSHHLMNSHTRSTPSSWLTLYLLAASVQHRDRVVATQVKSPKRQLTIGWLWFPGKQCCVVVHE